MKRLEFGLIVNPVAGIGGRVALKGSDGAAVQEEARRRHGRPRAGSRMERVLEAMGSACDEVSWKSWGGGMGAELLREHGVACEVLGETEGTSGPEDTRAAATVLAEGGVDLLVFAGGDGTARDVLAAVGQRIPVLGVPAGVKMHSGVFATTPEAAGRLLADLVAGGLVSLVVREVRDLDEAALRAGQLRPRFFGELRVPEPGGYLQHTKERGRENEDLAVTEIVADIVEHLEDRQDGNQPVVLGPGSTIGAVKRALGFEGTLLGFDVWQQGEVVARDVDADWLETLDGAVLVLSFTRGQGFLIGRGNQQLSPAFLRKIGRDALWVAGTRTKLKSLDGRPLLIDTDDPELDRDWSGLIEIVAGYEDRLLYQVAGVAGLQS